GEPVAEEPVMDKSIPESKSIDSERTAHEMAGVGKGGPSKAPAHVPAPKAAVKATPAEVPAATAVPATAVHGRRAHRRAGRESRRSGQCYHHLTHHDVHSVLLQDHPSLYECPQSPLNECGRHPGSMPQRRSPSPRDRGNWEISSASH